MIVSTLKSIYKKINNKVIHGTQNEKKVLMDIKGILNREKMLEAGYLYWRL